MKVFSHHYLTGLTDHARSSPRLRQHQNVHQHYQEPCQRLFNAIEPGSYIRPHRHASDPRDELLVAIRGLMALVVFDEQGRIVETIPLGTEKFGTQACPAIEIPSTMWHTVVALEQGSVLLEIKAGPFDPERPKDLAAWAPLENSPGAANYLQTLVRHIKTPRISPSLRMGS